MEKHEMMASAIIVAAGSSVRMGSDKILLPLCGAPVLAHTLAAFERCGHIGEIIVVTRPELMQTAWSIAKQQGVTKLRQIVQGGTTRSRSVKNGVLASDSAFPLVCIHDGARPLVTQRVILDALCCAAKVGCATAGVPMKDTVKLVESGVVVSTPDRKKLSVIQTPQVFLRSVYLDCCANIGQLDYSDDCQLVEASGRPVAVSLGDYENIKLTTPEDLLIAEALLTRRMKNENRTGI